MASQVDIGWRGYPIWSPDDHWIAFMRQTGARPAYTQTIAALDVLTGNERVLVSADQDTFLWPLGWSADGRFFYHLRGTTRSELWRVDTLRENTYEYIRLVSDGAIPRCYFLSPNGDAVLCSVLASRDPAAYAVVRVPTGQAQIETLISGATDAVYNPVWHPSGLEVTVAVPAERGSGPEMRSLTVGPRQARTLVHLDTGTLYPAAWAPDGRWLAALHYSDQGAELLVIDSELGQLARIPADGGIRFVGWLADGLGN